MNHLLGNQEMIMEKDVEVIMKDGETLYLNIFRPNKEGRFPVVQQTHMVKITNLKSLTWGQNGLP